MACERPHPEGHMLFEAQEVLVGDRKYVLLCHFLRSGLGMMPCSAAEQQAAMETFVQDTGLQDVLVRTAVPIQNWRSKLGSFPYATDGLTFVRETKTYDKFPYDRFREFNWQVIRHRERKECVQYMHA